MDDLGFRALRVALRFAGERMPDHAVNPKCTLLNPKCSRIPSPVLRAADGHSSRAGDHYRNRGFAAVGCRRLGGRRRGVWIRREVAAEAEGEEDFKRDVGEGTAPFCICPAHQICSDHRSGWAEAEVFEDLAFEQVPWYCTAAI